MTIRSSIIHPVPYFAQWESSELVPAIIAGTMRASEDPLWPKSGADSAQEYEFWSWRLCGMACLRMALHHWRGDAPPAVSLAQECVDAGAYIRHPDRVDGLIYAPFAAYAERRWGLAAQSRPDLPATDIAAHLHEGWLLVLSVHPSIRVLDPAPPRRGGHLVLAVGATPHALVIHNPSGFPGRSQQFAHIPWPDLERFYAGRGVILGAHTAPQE
ncbi:C39 family peptidase [Streptomyces xiangluensis]|uniref:C39 family peptidase n=1 Tax=Streptomyces xiangluensis TaxID=2665720 RepID=A0ABV8YQ42_9ACTN